MYYCYSELENPEETLFSMLTGKVHSLPGHIQAAYVQNIMKVLAIILSKGDNQQSIKVYSLVNKINKLKFEQIILFRYVNEYPINWLNMFQVAIWKFKNVQVQLCN